MPPRRRVMRLAQAPGLQRRNLLVRTRTRLKPLSTSRLIHRVPQIMSGVIKSNFSSTSPPVFRVSKQDNVKSKNSALKLPVGSNAHGSVSPARKISSILPLNAEATQIPNPTPVAVIPNSVAAGSPLLGTISTETGTSARTASSPTSVFTTKNTLKATSFSALPPLLSLGPTSSVISFEYTRAALPTITSLPSFTSTSSPEMKSHQVTAAVIILLSVGSALFLLGICIVIRMCARPRRLPRPTPSLPVLKDIEADSDFFEAKESPMFGGDTRLSSVADNDGPVWAWVQYPQTQAVPSPGSALHDYNASNAYTGDPQNTTRYHLATQTPTAASQTTERVSGKHTLQNVPAMAMSNKRFSATTSMHNATLHELVTSNDRIEITSTPDNHDIPKRPKSKVANRRSRLSGPEETRNRDSTTSFIGLAYDTDVASPSPTDYIQPVETPDIENPLEGRARVKSGYFAGGGYPRISTLPSASYSIATATRINVAQRNSFAKDKFAASHQSNSKRFRDTQALTYALGLASPKTDYGAASPQLTLYPDDSMSIHGKRRNQEVAPDMPITKSTQQGDTLMTMNFGVSQMSLTGLARDTTSGAHEPEPDRHVSKPPRVPSPPPLPSLAQMALAQHNPDAYASYRSPTYSLYGLYENPDRKSLAR